MIWISLRAGNGNQWSARNDDARTVLADRQGVGPWELFQVTALDSPSGAIVNGRRIRLQTRWARYVVADGARGDQILADRIQGGTWETFHVQTESGSAGVQHGGRIALVAHDGRRVVTEAGAAGRLFANGASSSAPEMFQVGLWDTLLVHLRTRASGPYVVAEQDGRVLADRVSPRRWETFVLVFPHRPEGGLRSGDRVFLRAWDGRYLSAAGGGGGVLTASENRADTRETFTLLSRDGREAIGHGSEIALGTSDGVHFVVAEGDGGGDVNASRTQPGTWETFTLELAEHGPIPVANAPTAPIAPGHPFPSPRRPVSRTQPLMVFLVSYSDMPAEPDPTLTPDLVEQAIFSSRSSIRAWFEQVSLDSQSISNAGVFGPIRLPFPYSVYDENGAAYPLNATRRAPDVWETFVLETVVGGPILAGAHVRIKTGTTYVKHRGGPSSHLTAGASGDEREAYFTLERADGRDGPVYPWDEVHLVASNGRYVTAESGGGDLLEASRDVPSTWETFRIERSRSGPLQSGHSIHLRTHSSGLYVCADQQGRWPDLFNTLRRRGISLDALTRADALRAVPLMLDFSNAGGGSKRGVNFTAVGGLAYSSEVTSIALSLQGGGPQGAAQLSERQGTITHELCHLILGLPDRYNYRKPIHGDLTVDRPGLSAAETFTVERLDGTISIIVHGEAIRLRDGTTGAYVSAPTGGDDLVNLRPGPPSESETFVIERKLGSGTVLPRDEVSLRAMGRRYWAAQRGGGEWLAANRGTPGPWETFAIQNVGGRGAIAGGTRVGFAHSGPAGRHFVSAKVDGRTRDAASLARGWERGDGAGTGPGGSFDIMDGYDEIVLMTAYDRLRRGWLEPRVLTPEHRICVRFERESDLAEAVVLWDPELPGEWYVVEHRYPRRDVDEVPSAGLIVSWVDERPETWSSRLTPDLEGGLHWYPAVIAAGAHHHPPNPLIAPTTMRPVATFGRRAANAAFTTETVVLSRGDGTPSRFRIAFGRAGESGRTLAILGP